jgi:corrinoid protein of di/trimethylamine methyltransferase
MGEEMLDQLKAAVIECDEKTAVELTAKALAEGLLPIDIITEGLDPAMDKIAKMYEDREVALPQLILAADAFHSSLDVLKPVMLDDQQKFKGRVVIGTVECDIHGLGKELVKTMLEVAGFECFDLGVDVPAAAFIEKVKEVDAELIAASTLMTTTLEMQKEIVDAAVEAGIRDKIKILIGGAPVSQEWADVIGADGYADDAIAAMKVAEILVGLS